MKKAKRNLIRMWKSPNKVIPIQQSLSAWLALLCHQQNHLVKEGV